MNDSGTIWVHPGRIANVEPAPGGHMVTIDSTSVSFAAMDLAEGAVIRGVDIQTKVSNSDDDFVSYTVLLQRLQDFVRVDAPVMVETDADDDIVTHLHPDAFYQEPVLPKELYLACPAEGRGRWFSKVDEKAIESVYRCPCGVRWDVLPDQDEDMD